MPTEYIFREVSEFIILPIRHISLVNDLFQSVLMQSERPISSADRKIVEGEC